MKILADCWFHLNRNTSRRSIEAAVIYDLRHFFHRLIFGVGKQKFMMLLSVTILRHEAHLHFSNIKGVDDFNNKMLSRDISVISFEKYKDSITRLDTCRSVDTKERYLVCLLFRRTISVLCCVHSNSCKSNLIPEFHGVGLLQI